MTTADEEDNEAGRRDFAARRAARAKRNAAVLTVLDGLQLEQLAQYAGHSSGPSWLTVGVILARIMIQWWPHPDLSSGELVLIRPRTPRGSRQVR